MRVKNGLNGGGARSAFSANAAASLSGADNGNDACPARSDAASATGRDEAILVPLADNASLEFDMFDDDLDALEQQSPKPRDLVKNGLVIPYRTEEKSLLAKGFLGE